MAVGKAAAGLIAAATALVVAGGLWPALWELCALARDPVLAGQLWRLWSGHWMHLDGAHAGVNLLALVVIIGMAQRLRLLRPMLGMAVLMMPLLSLAILLVRPDLYWYVGLSGLLHGALVWLLLRQGGQLAWLGLGLITLKLIAQAAGDTEPWVVQEAHWLGALLGAVMAMIDRLQEWGSAP